MLNKKIVIIGNGFDLAHNLETKWSDFRNYLEIYDSDLFCLLNQNASEKLWSDFEKDLGHFNLNRFYENQLKNFDCIKNDEDDGNSHHKANQIRHRENQIIDGIKKTLNDWILSIDTTADALPNVAKILDHAKIITFNYTSTLEETYNIAKSDIIYLHGKATENLRSSSQKDWEDDPIPEIVVGHGEKVFPTDITEFAYSASDKIVLGEVEEDHRDILLELRKDTSQYMHRITDCLCQAETYDELFIIGHSLSDIDAPYFNTISSYTNSNTKIFTTFHPPYENITQKKNRVRHFFPENNITVQEINQL